MSLRRIGIAVASVMLVACGASKPRAEAPHARSLPPRAERAAASDVPDDEAHDVSTVDVPEPREGEPSDANGSKPGDSDDPERARQEALQEASEQGLIGLLGVGGDVDASAGGIFDPRTGATLSSLGGGLGAVGTLRIANRADGVDLETRARVRADAGPKKPVVPTRVRVSRVVASGIDVDAVSGAFDRSDLAVRACYEARLASNPKAQAKVVLELGIGKDGRATGTAVASPSDEVLSKRLLAAASDMRFSVTAPAKATVELSLERPPD